MGNFNLFDMTQKMFCKNNLVATDDAGLPSLLVFIPAFKNSDVLAGGDDNIHPAFIVNGVQISGFFYSKYENVVYNGKAYSLPAENPKSTVTFDTAREYCEAKGYGWHMSTAAEWAAIALWSKKNGTLPYGNNRYGRDSRESENKAIPATYGDDGSIAKVATGTGPLTWSHDGTASGIWDMNGNNIEWQGGVRVVWGELQILANNDAADPDNPQNQTGTCWKAINAADGSLVDPESKTTDSSCKTTGSTVKLDYVDNVWTYSTTITSADNSGRYCLFCDIQCTANIGDATKLLLRSLALLPDEGSVAEDYENDFVYWNNNAMECCVNRGGQWSHSGGSGVFAILGHFTRADTTPSSGFRAAYIPNI